MSEGEPMDRDTYKTELQSLLDAGHIFLSRLHKVTDQISDAATAEWNTVFKAANAASLATDLIYRELYPLPSGLTDSDSVDMVCVACRKPAEHVRGHEPGAWQHKTEDDAVDCPASGSPVIVMVAAGNENVPNSFQEDQNRLARKMDDPDRTDWDFTKPALGTGPLDA